MKKGEEARNRTIRARVRGGVLEPLEKIELAEGEEVTVLVDVPPTADEIEAFRRAADSWRGKVDAEALIRNIHRSEL